MIGQFVDIYEGQILVVLLGILFLHAFYRIFKTVWPEFYFSLSDHTGLFISLSPQRYFAFTILPAFIVYLVLITAFGSAYTFTEPILLGMLGSTLYALSKNGIALVKALLRHQSIQIYFNYWAQILLHVFTIFVLVIAGAIAGYFSTLPIVHVLLPTLEGLIDNLWAALFGAMLGGLLLRALEENRFELDNIVDKSKNSLSEEILAAISKYSTKYNADKKVLLAVAIVENLERPSWVRKIERMKGVLIKKGSYGIMQVYSPIPITDAKSIELAAKNYFADTDYQVDYELVMERLKSFNDEPRFLELVERTLSYLPYEVL